MLFHQADPTNHVHLINTGEAVTGASVNLSGICQAALAEHSGYIKRTSVYYETSRGVAFDTTPTSTLQRGAENLIFFVYSLLHVFDL